MKSKRQFANANIETDRKKICLIIQADVRTPFIVWWQSPNLEKSLSRIKPLESRWEIGESLGSMNAVVLWRDQPGLLIAILNERLPSEMRAFMRWAL